LDFDDRPVAIKYVQYFSSWRHQTMCHSFVHVSQTHTLSHT
jgi:hypothetical protein